MDPPVCGLERPAFAARTHRHDLGEDRDSSLRGTVSADVEPCRSCDSLERGLVDSRIEQELAAYVRRETSASQIALR